MGNQYAEVTYDRGTNIMFVDIYQKVNHIFIMYESLDFERHTNENG